MNADITILCNAMVVNQTDNCSVEKAMACADELGMWYNMDEGLESVTIFGDKDQLWHFLHTFSLHYMTLTIE